MSNGRGHELVNDWSFIALGGGISFALSIWIFKVVGPAISTKFTSSYSTLSAPAQAEWNDRIISNVNAVVAIVLASYSLCTDGDMKTDVVWHDSTTARLACSIIIGYMIADITIMVLWCTVNTKELIGFIFHHLATAYAYYYVSVYGILCYFAMLRLIAEVSTPAMNQRWFFDVAGYQRGSIMVVTNGCLMLLTFFIFRLLVLPVFWYQIWQVTGTQPVAVLGHIQITVIWFFDVAGYQRGSIMVVTNGCLMLLTFFIFRLLVLPVFWYQIWQVTGTQPVAVLGHIQITVMYVPSLILDCLNLFWFYKMCKGFIKAVKTMINKQATNVEKTWEQHRKEG